MYVCLCKGITDSQIRRAVASGMHRFSDVREALGLATQCGKCGLAAREIFHEAKEAGAQFYAAARAVA
jgi:bacterioferritin-associated ferredoxin